MEGGDSFRRLVILSGKGGVGKSTVCVNICRGLSSLGKRVGLLDLDLCGPSIPCLMDMESCGVTQGTKGWIPVTCPSDPNIQVMSMGFLTSNPDSAIVWRGPKKNSMLTQLFHCVEWDKIDYLVMDTPPGTSDEHISIVEMLHSNKGDASGDASGDVPGIDGAIMVSTPQGLACNDVRRQIHFCKMANIPILGLIENMSGFTCPHCDHCTNIFSSDGAKSLCDVTGIPFLGRIPIDLSISDECPSDSTINPETKDILSQIVQSLM